GDQGESGIRQACRRLDEPHRGIEQVGRDKPGGHHGKNVPRGVSVRSYRRYPDLVRRRLPQTWSGGDRTGRRIKGLIRWARGPRDVGRSLPSVEDLARGPFL